MRSSAIRPFANVLASTTDNTRTTTTVRASLKAVGRLPLSRPLAQILKRYGLGHASASRYSVTTFEKALGLVIWHKCPPGRPCAAGKGGRHNRLPQN